MLLREDHAQWLWGIVRRASEGCLEEMLQMLCVFVGSALDGHFPNFPKVMLRMFQIAYQILSKLGIRLASSTTCGFSDPILRLNGLSWQVLVGPEAARERESHLISP